MSSLSSKLLDPNYKPLDRTKAQASSSIGMPFYAGKFVRCPVKFTQDPMEFMESSEYMDLELRPVQKQVIEDLFMSFNDNGSPKYGEAVLICGMRGGKCNRKGTPILMSDGTIKKIEDIKVGDKVMGPDSHPRVVLHTTEGTSELFEIQQSCADTYVVNDAHILSLKKADSVAGGMGSSRGVEVRYKDEPNIVNIGIKDYIAKSKKWKYFFRGYKAGCFEFKSQAVLLDPYFMGLWLGDGSSKSAQITSMDKEIENYIFNFAKSMNTSVRVYQKLNNKAKEFTIRKGDNKIHVLGLLRDIGVYGNKHIPQCYISNSKEVRLQVLAGIIDTDGHLKKDKKCYEITLANKTLIYDVKRLADTLGFCTNIREKKTSCINKETGYSFKGIAWRLTIYGEGIEEIPCKIPRKQCILNGARSNKQFGLSSLKVRSIGIGEYAGIAVDKDNLFCLADGTVTHNSAVAAMSCAWLTHRLLQYDDPAAAFGQVPGYQLSAQFIATSEAQSKQTAYASFEALMSNPWWKKYIQYLKEREESEGKDTLFQNLTQQIYFKEKNLIIKSLHSNSNALAGMTSYIVVFDEMSRFKVGENVTQGETERSTAQAVYNTSSRAVTSLRPISRVLTVTSPIYETDYGMRLLYNAGTVHTGQNARITESLRKKYNPVNGRNKKMVGYHYTTFEMAPLGVNKKGISIGVDEADEINKKNENPIAYNRDYYAIPPGSENPFFEHAEWIEMCLAPMECDIKFTDRIITDVVNVDGVMEHRKYIAKDVLIPKGDKSKRYFICCDQGEKRCKFVVCMGHIEDYTKVKDTTANYKIVIDFIEEWTPDQANEITVSFPNVEEVIRVLAAKYNIIRVTYDQWQSVESIQRLFAQGVLSSRLEINTKMYEEFKRMVYSGLVEMPKSDLLITELRQLNLIRGTIIDKPNGGSKDAADAACRVVYSCYGDYIESALRGDTGTAARAIHMPTTRNVYDAMERADQAAQKGKTNSIYHKYSVFGDSDTFVTSNVQGMMNRKKAFNLEKMLSK